MPKTIDCYLIGHNEIEFRKYEKLVRKTGLESRAYRYIDTSFIQYKNEIYNEAIREKIKNPAQREVGDDVIRRIKQSAAFGGNEANKQKIAKVSEQKSLFDVDF
ncbi:MAG: hypothetical protein GY757_34810 [bacterium]|nr:hypothetical protein [bacterium]